MSNIQDYGTYSYITLDTMVAGAKMRLGLRDTTMEDIFLRDLAIEAVKKLRAKQSFIQCQAQLPIDKTSKRAKLPEGFIRLNRYHGWAFVGADGQVPNDGRIGFGPYPSDQPFFENQPFNTIRPTVVSTMQENDGYLVFSTNTDAEWVLISYLSSNIDENGDIKIPMLYDLFVIPYICWQYELSRKNYSASDRWEPIYKQNLGAVRGIANHADAPAMQITAIKMNAMF